MQNFMKTILSAMKSWTKKEIKKEISNAPVVAPDWNESNPDSINYIKNRTHWEEMASVVLVDKLTQADYEDDNHPLCNFIPNQKYDVIWNGKLYSDLICKGDGDYNVIANGGNNYPFYINDDGGNGLFINSDENNWTVSILTTQMVAHKLDSKYLDIPDNIATIDDVQGAIDVANNIADSKMDKTNPVGTGSFSLNREANSAIGDYSIASGLGTIAKYASDNVQGQYNLEYFCSVPRLWSRQAYFSNKGTEYYYSQNISIDNLAGTFTILEPQRDALAMIPKDCYFAASVTGTTTYYKQVGNGWAWAYDIEMASTSDRGAYAQIVGNGTSDEARSNAHTLAWDGTAWYQGDVYVGSTSGINKDEGSKKLATEEYVDAAISGIEIPEGSSVELDTTLTEAGKAAEAKATGDAIKNLSDSLSTVATSGSYNDLEDKPTIPSVEGLATTDYVADQIAEAMVEVYVQDEAPSDVSGDAIWVDTSKDGLPNDTRTTTNVYVVDAATTDITKVDFSAYAIGDVILVTTS